MENGVALSDENPPNHLSELRRRRQRELRKFAYIIMRFARFARAIIIFVYVATVLVLSTK